MKLISDFIDKIKLKLLLRKYGCKTVEEYNHNHDPHINRRANLVSEFYHGYPYYMRIPDSIFLKQDIWFDPIYVLNNWCKEHCKDKWRYDWHRVGVPRHMNGYDMPEFTYINDLAGEDALYVAFMSHKDYNWFILSHDFT